jgi:hypothetical protein
MPVHLLVFSTFLYAAFTAHVDRPVAPILPDRHGVSPSGRGAEHVPCPWVALLALTPVAITGLVAVPRASVFAVVELHGDAMLEALRGGALRLPALGFQPLAGVFDLRLDA